MVDMQEQREDQQGQLKTRQTQSGPALSHAHVTLQLPQTFAAGEGVQTPVPAPLAPRW
jgi:hypothetical protein